MTRVADSTIKGFLYQFNKTLIEILDADQDKEITIEGIIEDIDIRSDSGETTAIQCKYHESVANFTTSLIYKPLLQMAEAYSKLSEPKSIRYKIFIHVPSEGESIRKVTKAEIDAALATQDVNHIKIAQRIVEPFSSENFATMVDLEFGPSLDTIEEIVKTKLDLLNIKSSDTPCILYPNALSNIAKKSSLSVEADRKITKLELQKYLSGITNTVITKWTLALKNKKEILQTTRKQLKVNLNTNSQNRYFYFEPNSVSDFSNNIVTFISNFVSIYHCKPAHIKPPLFAIDCTRDILQDIQYRLYTKGIKSNTGLIGNNFIPEEFYKEPILKKTNNKIEDREFHIRLLAFTDYPEGLGHKKGDEFFFICNEIPASIDISDTNVHLIGVNTFHELEFIMHLRETYE
ncbi:MULTISPECIES: hypothetical protein [Pseudomonas]|uniref:hypothetical protein n=1 Tax=Pseudomonas TaxID=286 RepID=UPI0005FACC9B|nr:MULTISPECIES: hypothetical protein [Pseudomonas]KJZ36305.1 hypothetical protein VC33_17415 [Pseudomonas fluorescens]OOG10104.1 hypothetical protein BMS17_26600 [Pseudomonas sp. C9]